MLNNFVFSRFHPLFGLPFSPNPLSADDLSTIIMNFPNCPKTWPKIPFSRNFQGLENGISGFANFSQTYKDYNYEPLPEYHDPMLRYFAKIINFLYLNYYKRSYLSTFYS